MNVPPLKVLSVEEAVETKHQHYDTIRDRRKATIHVQNSFGIFSFAPLGNYWDEFVDEREEKERSKLNNSKFAENIKN